MKSSMGRQIRTVALVCLTMVVLSLQSLAAGREVENWTRALGLQSSVPGLKLLPFYVMSVGETGGQLTGVCIYLNEGEAPNSRRVTLEVQTDGEEFWAIAVLQVASDVKGPWEPIGSSTGTGQIIKLKIDPGARSPQLTVNLEAYRSFIGKQKFGRIGLKSGDGAIFELADLKRPTEGE